MGVGTNKPFPRTASPNLWTLDGSHASETRLPDIVGARLATSLLSSCRILYTLILLICIWS